MSRLPHGYQTLIQERAAQLTTRAFSRLSVSFIQMLKAFHPVAILLISAAFKIQSESLRKDI